MKKIIVTCALLTVGSMVSFAQNANTPNAAPKAGQTAQANQAPMTAADRAQRLSKRDEMMFTLTPEQSKKVYDVELEFVTAMDKFRTENKQAGPAERNAILDKKDAKMKAILTPEQYTKYDMSRNRQRNAPQTPGGAQQPGKPQQQGNAQPQGK